jgi:hypothetical protein
MKKLIVTPQGEQLIDLTAEEITQAEQAIIQDKINRDAIYVDVHAVKDSAITKLKALGLNDAEIKSIIG